MYMPTVLHGAGHNLILEQDMASVEDAKDDKFRPEAIISLTVESCRETLSPQFYVRELPWQIKIVPNVRLDLCFVLQCNGENNSPTWSCRAIAHSRLKRHKPNSKPGALRRIDHLFCAERNNHGYPIIISWKEVKDPNNCYLRNDSITFEMHVIADDHHGAIWDSKKRTGYIGIKNQPAACFMNSLLQTLYFTNHLRRAVYNMPTKADDSPETVGLSLQRVFYDLQFRSRPVDAESLIKSFGCEIQNSSIYIQKFLRVVFDKLEPEMKGTPFEGTIHSLFEGEITSYILCKNVDYKSFRYETFYGIQLNIENKKNIYESFQDYIASESLEGDNKYDAGVHGLQEASKGVFFTAFPPVLHLHLTRFQHHVDSIKYNDRFEFYEEIDLDPFLAENGKTPAIYILHAVLAHSGEDGVEGYHVVFIHPKADGKWFKFHDDIVSTCRKEEAIEQNYGGMNDEKPFHVKCTNAIMLVYIRKSELDHVLNDIAENEVIDKLGERFNSI